MTIKYKEINENGEIFIEQEATRPTVYLDNWAIDLFSFENKELGDSFLSIMNEVNGTIAFSIINLFEITHRADKSQVHRIMNYLESFNGVFIDSNPCYVIKKEKNMSAPLIYSPCADFVMLKELAIHTQGNLSLLHFSEVISLLEKVMKEPGRTVEENFERELFPFIDSARKNNQRLELAKQKVRLKIKKKDLSIPYTKELSEFLIEYIVSNETMKMGNNEWRDVFNLIVPVSYCDFVLCDNRWRDFINITGLKYPDIAKVYSKKTLEQFLFDLKHYHKDRRG